MGWFIRFKEFLKKFLPPPVNAFNREMGTLRRFIEKQINGLRSAQKKETNRVLEILAQQQKQINIQQWQFESMAGKLQENLLFQQTLGERMLALEQQMLGLKEQILELDKFEAIENNFKAIEESIRKNIIDGNAQIKKLISDESKNRNEIEQQILTERKKNFDMLEKIRIQSLDASSYSSESVWGEIFNDTTNDSKWLHNKTFSPGRWAVGYQYLYVMYRVLNETHPKCILELGLGQSTKMISQYAAEHDGVEHIVVEQDKEWVSFFANNYQIGPNTRLVYLPAIETEFKDDTKTLVYKDFVDLIGETRFDFVSVDGPGHSRSNKYRRIDLIKMIPQNLNSKFCIMLDDYNDPACRNAWEIVKETFEKSNIEFSEGIYRGRKTVALLADPTQKFLCSM